MEIIRLGNKICPRCKSYHTIYLEIDDNKKYKFTNGCKDCGCRWLDNKEIN